MGLLNKIGNILFRGMTKSAGVECLNPYIGLILKADDNDLIADELFRVSLAYQYGQYGLRSDSEKAKEYCRKAAERGHAAAQLNMAMWTMTKPDDSSKEVLDWLQKAADQGERQALYNLGISYHRGDLGNPDISESLKLVRKSAERYYGTAYVRLAFLYLNGDGKIPADIRRARFFALKGIMDDIPDAHNLFMLMATHEEQESGHIDANEIVESAVSAGEPLAAIEKYMSLCGQNKSNIDTAISELEKYTETGCVLINEILGILYIEKKQYDKAVANFEVGAKDGLEWSQYYLAHAFYKGFGIEKDIEKALLWVGKSLNSGNNQARKLFAQMIMNNDLQDILPDKVMRGPAYLELSDSQTKQQNNGE